MLKRILSVVLVVVLLCAMLPYLQTMTLAAGRYSVNNTKNATGQEIVNQARSLGKLGATYWSGIDPWQASIYWRTGFAYNGQTSFDCSGFVGRVLNDCGFRGVLYTPSYGNCVLSQNYGSGYIGISIEELVNYGTDISDAVVRAKNGDYSGLQTGDIIGWTSGSLGRHIIIYAGLNNGVPWMVEFTGSGFLDRAISSSYQSAFQYGARVTNHSGTDSSYIGKCSSEPAYCSLEIAKTTTIKTLPCSKDTCADSGDIATLSSGTLTATRIYKNTANNYWYKVSYNGKDGYIYSGDTKVVKFLTDDVGISGVSAPTTLSQGSSFSIAGTISSKYNVLSNVSAYVYPGSATSGSASTGTSANVSTYSYSLTGSAVDSGVVFGSLSAGSYTYCISATAKSYYCTDGKNLQSNTTKKTLHTSGFAVTGGTVSDTLSISNYNYPTSIKQGNVYSIYGTITSTYSNISSATVGVYDSSGNMKTGKTAYPNTKTYNIANLDNYVYFNNLTAGTYYYRVTASNSAGSKQLLNKQFTVTGGSASLTVLRTVNCKHRVTLPARVINLYKNPTDTTRTTYFDYGPTVTCPTYAKMSDGSTMFCANVNHQGVDTQMWFKFEADMKTEVKHTFGSYQYDYAHPHAEYHTCDCGYTEYTGDYSYRDGCDDCIPRIELSTYNVYLDLRDNPTQVVDVTALGNLPSRYSTRYERKTDSVSCSWNGWNGNVAPLTVTAKARGSGYVTISLVDKSEGEEVIYSLSLYVSVSSPTYTVSYNANGGTNAPSSQTKYYNETLYLSEAQPYRENYEFMGWSTSSSSSYYDYLPGSSYTSNSSVTLYAVWKEHVHSYTQWPVAPTCTEEGYTVYSCNCGYGYTGNSVPALGHAWDGGTVIKEPLENEAGEKLFSCIRCMATKTESIPALGHTHSYNSTTVAPTCTDKGYTTHTCVCGESYVDSYVPALGHAWDGGVVTKQPTETTEGVKSFTCTRCDATRTESIPATGDKPCDGGENCPSAKFVDVNTKEWYHPYVDYAVAHGLFSGTGENTFEPETAMTRAMLVTVLWRYEGQPEGYENTFVDVNAKSGSWYIDAVAWAAANNIVGGIGDGKFDPEGKITREQMATILFRYANWKGIDTSKRGDLNTFPDGSKTAGWAKEAMQWTVAEKIIGGSDGKLLPQGSATRAQVATILMRFIENIVNK